MFGERCRNKPQWHVWGGEADDGGSSESTRESVMSHYLLNNIQPQGRSLDPEQLQRVIADVTALTQQMQQAGVWVFALPLTDPSASTVVRHTGSGVNLSDGPFAEAKEYVGGLTVIDVPDLDIALEWAGKVSAATGLPIEVRPAMTFGG